MRISPRLRYAFQDLLFVTRRTAKRVGAVVTPVRATAAVALVAVVALAVSQFLDYSSLAVGAEDYSAYEEGAGVPPPLVEPERSDFGGIHIAVVLLLAIAALVALVRAMTGRWALGWALAVIGAVVIVIALAIDVPAGLDEGETTLTYRSPEATLESGLWIELVAAAVLVAAGALIVRHGRGEGGGSQ